jgi:GTP-binding protein Era
MNAPWKAGFVGLIGHPNAGKSSLLNQLVGQKLAIVTPKPQTTRRRVQGMLCDENLQIIFVDAPGVLNASRGLNKFLSDEWRAVREESDALIAVLPLDAAEWTDIEDVLAIAHNSKKPWCAYIAKCDLPLPDRRDRIRAWLEMKKIPFVEGSVLDDGRALARSFAQILGPHLPESTGPLFDPETVTPHPVREIAGELIREAAFLNLHQEIPYSLAVHVQRYEETGSLHRIFAEIVVAKANHKKIVIGRGGQTIKAIGITARKSIEDMTESRIHLELNVRVRENWTTEPRSLKELGYDIPTSAGGTP